mmetsp:Transcript_9132/g.25671  ORF Transcript_9132/g.25671 Transcript_9132/m.25671 type:complete len:478 (+) Transcript_9132:57-1490(+)
MAPSGAHFWRDVPNMALLVILYSFQGLPMGLFLKSVPLLFKQYLSYQEIGLIMMATLPYSWKFLWAPVIDIYQISSIGKRKSWIVPAQFAGCLVLFYLYYNVQALLEERRVYLLSGVLIFNTFVITCQDIAVDGWAVEILHPTNSAYASACQSVGLRTGMGISTTIFIALNTVEFCNKWIYAAGDARAEPLVTIPSFILCWGVSQFLVTVYILLVVPEKVKYAPDGGAPGEGDAGEDDDEITIKPSQILGITWDILKNRNFIYFMVFLTLTFAANSIENNLSQVYLTSDLKFSKESLVSIKIVSVPLNFVATFISSSLSRERPFAMMTKIVLLNIVASCYAIFAMLGTFPVEQADQQSRLNLAHVAFVTLFTELSGTLWFVTLFAIIFKIVDKKIAGMHITLLASLTNQCQFIHKFYLFEFVDRLGIFIPQAVLTVISLAAFVAMQSRITAMDDTPIGTWHVSPELLASGDGERKAK